MSEVVGGSTGATPPKDNVPGILGTKKTPEQFWASIKGEVGNQEHLNKLLDEVGPEAYNDFIHSDHYKTVG